ncbi:hypothetical protein [Carboxylicivirga caseinilyticus]|uniref:hypothetical protein n=1 Tax=Carboxylicivirga caseinilyticus TaxID=3417572 RepID=UPI003D32630F|nr:hypothetical protein [Marinilabiliaceae bacterium A049]
MSKNGFSPDYWSHAYGIASVAGLILTIVGFFYAYNHLEATMAKIVDTLFYVIIAILFVFIVSASYYTRRLRKMDSLPLIAENNRTYANQLFEINKQMAESFHYISHYNRNILNFLEKVDLEDLNDQSYKEIVHRFSSFLVNVTSCLRQFYTTASGSVCAISIKIIDDEYKFVRTYFRDPISLKKRRRTDNYYHSGNGAYQTHENTAFDVILNEGYVNVFFANDDLQGLHKKHMYENSSPFWFENYNATIVVPISMIIASNERHILGFLTVDNNTGELNETSKVEFLFSVADLMYNALDKYFRISIFAQSKKIQHAELDKFNWS